MVVGSFSQETDLLIIGGGPGGYSAAFRAAELGVKTTIVDRREALGGVCLHEGCIPSKTLLHAVQCIRQAETARSFGISFSQPDIDLDELRQWVQRTVATLAKGLGGIGKKLKVEQATGIAHFDDSRNVTVTNGDTVRLRFRRAVIATGSKAKEHPLLTFDLPGVWKPTEAVQLPSVPKSLLIVGENYMSIELACIYAGLGSDVTLVTESDRLLPAADEDLLRVALRSLKDELTEICTGVSVIDVEANDDGVHLKFSGDNQPKRSDFDAVIVSIGQVGNVDGLALNTTQVKMTDDDFVTIDEQMRTTDPRIFAVGDVTGPDLLADKAIAQGRVCAEVAAGWDSVFDARVIPMVAFTEPNIAWAGLTEQTAKAEGRAISVRKIPWGASGRAAGMKRTEGMTKLICEKDSELVLGVGIVGTNAAEMIGEAALAIEMGATITDLAATVHPHPTTCELISEAARAE